jgi:hypothetical protein
MTFSIFGVPFKIVMRHENFMKKNKKGMMHTVRSCGMCQSMTNVIMKLSFWGLG